MAEFGRKHFLDGRIRTPPPREWQIEGRTLTDQILYPEFCPDSILERGSLQGLGQKMSMEQKGPPPSFFLFPPPRQEWKDTSKGGLPRPLLCAQKGRSRHAASSGMGGLTGETWGREWGASFSVVVLRGLGSLPIDSRVPH